MCGEQVYCQLWHKKCKLTWENEQFKFPLRIISLKRHKTTHKIADLNQILIYNEEKSISPKYSTEKTFDSIFSRFYNHFSQFSVYGTRFDFIFAVGQYEKRFWIEILWEKICSRIHLKFKFWINQPVGSKVFFLNKLPFTQKCFFSSRTASYLLKIT